ncbi:MAG: Metallopeptidase [uncultured Gemmatimonadetes bacterium]|uniref:Metallopeptidase n=1 Tax=uncultured Gemmatimonadota bacterium TaxID=203437 RepID=A0A6J4M0K7_9BACT|nr:MAG: Metallopeptidase [uncultured Gemmatimonadota bacterium]
MTPSKQLLALALAATFAGTASAQTPGVDTTNFDRSVRPQDDFFRYVNGGWLKRTEIPADRSSYGSFVQLRDRSEEAVRAIVEEAAAARGAQPGSETQKVGDLYASYMDSARVEAAGIAPLRPELARIAALRDRAALPELYARLMRMGVQTPMGFGVGQDARQATRYIASVGQSGLGLPDRDYYLKQDPKLAAARAAYQTYLETVLRLAGDRDPAAGARAVLAFETALAEKHWDRARSRDREATYNLRTVAQLDSIMPGFSWGRFLRAANAASTPGVVVRQPDYLTAMNQVMASTPLPVLKQYLTVKLVDSYASALSSPFVNAQFAYRGKALQGLETNRPRWKRAVGAVEGTLGEAAGRLYVQRSFRPESRERMQQLVGNLREAFREAIDSLEWMSPATKVQAQAKLSKFNVKIGYPDQWRDYSALEVRRGDLAGNMMRAAEFGYNRMVRRLGQPIDRGEWGMTPQTVNAYYSSTMNEIVFPAAILQPPFFDPSADDAVNYGGIGAVIGHEISHGFDDQGRRSDGEGNLRDWWTEADNAAFKTRADALVEQYGAFSPLEGLNVNGRLTLGENIGDVSGLAMAYRAYRKSLNGREAPVINGLTGDQRFFMGWAQVWRSLQRPDALRQQIMTDTHSPGEYRVNGVLRNIPEFYRAYNVQPGDKMYLPPEKRVKIW